MNNDTGGYMGTLYTNFEQARINNEVGKIVNDLISIGGVDWAVHTVNQIPSFTDPYQENLRLQLKEKLIKLNQYVL